MMNTHQQEAEENIIYAAAVPAETDDVKYVEKKEISRKAQKNRKIGYRLVSNDLIDVLPSDNYNEDIFITETKAEDSDSEECVLLLDDLTVERYAEILGVDIAREPELLYIVENGLKDIKQNKVCALDNNGNVFLSLEAGNHPLNIIHRALIDRKRRELFGKLGSGNDDTSHDNSCQVPGFVEKYNIVENFHIKIIDSGNTNLDGDDNQQEEDFRKPHSQGITFSNSNQTLMTTRIFQLLVLLLVLLLLFSITIHFMHYCNEEHTFADV